MSYTLKEAKLKAFRASYLYALSDTEASYLDDGLALVYTEGEQAGRVYAFGESTVVAQEHEIDLQQIPHETKLYLPALYDMHFHWVQDDVREMPKTSLIEWLETYTFPAEAKFADPDYAELKAAFFWKRILKTGTIGGLCYSSIHEVALDAAMEYAPEHFKIGNVLMDMNCPDYLQQTVGGAIASVQSCAKKYGDRYVCSPRFAPTTSPQVMEASAKAAKAHGCFQQTHLDETLAEIDWVLGLYRKLSGFSDIEDYTSIYNRVGMLGPKTVFGHCIHLSDTEWKLLADSDSIIASCPSSNAPLDELGLGSGLFDFQLAHKYGVRWALASDIGGGPFLSMFDAMRSFVQQNRDSGHSTASYVQALYRSSTMSASLLGLGETKGRIAQGYDFDCIELKAEAAVLERGDPEEILAHLIESVADRNEYDDLVEDTIILGQSCF